MLVNIDDVPFKVRCPNLRPECYTESGDFSGESTLLEGLYGEAREETRLAFFPRRIQDGVYESYLNGHFAWEGITVPTTNWGLIYPPGAGGADDGMLVYGVADNIAQVLEHFEAFVKDPIRQFVIEISWMRKSQQEERGGWRWHKWGPYIGTQTPTTEYLYDEPLIEAVLVFHMYEVKLPEPITTEGR